MKTMDQKIRDDAAYKKHQGCQSRYLVIGPLGAEGDADKLDILLARRARLAEAIHVIGDELMELNRQIDALVERAVAPANENHELAEAPVRLFLPAA